MCRVAVGFNGREANVAIRITDGARRGDGFGARVDCRSIDCIQVVNFEGNIYFGSMQDHHFMTNSHLPLTASPCFS